MPSEKQFVLVSYHVSNLDLFALAAVLDYQRLRRTDWAGFTGAVFRNNVFRLVSQIVQVVPINIIPKVKLFQAWLSDQLFFREMVIWLDSSKAADQLMVICHHSDWISACSYCDIRTQ